MPSPIRAGVVLLVSALAGGCAASGTLGPTSAAGPAARQVTRPLGHHVAGVSWTAAGLAPHDLIYVTNSNGLVSVYRYWQHTLAGVLYNFSYPTGECADSAGDVYIADFDAQTIVEYAHGGTKPIRTIDDFTYHPYGCAVDPKSGNLAVANYQANQYSYNSDSGNIAVYPRGKDKPAYYGSGDGRFTSLAYDDHGDLLATARSYYYYSFFFNTIFYYLPDKSSKLLSMDLPGSQFYSGWPSVQSIGYDGKYWVVVASDTLYRYTISIKAQLVDEVELSGGSSNVNEIAFYRKNSKGIATQVVGGGASFEGSSFVGFWNYPAGGDPYDQITTYLDGPFGVAISLKK